MANTLVKFNRKFTQTELSNAVGTSTIATSNAVVDGTWYIAKTGATALYVGSIESAGTDAVLKLVAQINSNTLTGKEITTLINNYIANPSPDSTATLITKVDSAVKDKDGNQIDTTYKKLQTAKTDPTASSTTSTTFIDSITQNANGEITATKKTLPAYKPVQTAVADVSASGTATTAVTSVTQNTDGVITVTKANLPTTETGSKSASSSTAAIATNTDVSSASAAIAVATGYNIKQVSGAVSDTSTISSGRADKFGAANAALTQAKSYADGLISDLGAIMTFKGTQATETALKSNITTPKKGDVYIVTEDGSEWVYSGDSVDASHAYDSTKWEKFGTTDVNGALYKGTNALTDGTLVIADGTDGKMKAVSDSDIATRLADETAFTGAFKPLQTAITTDPTASGTASAVVTSVKQDANGVITVARANVPSGSGSVGSSSSAADAWKTVVHDVSLSGHTLSGNTKSIPAASGTSSGSDGYMTASQAVKLAGIESGAEVNVLDTIDADSGQLQLGASPGTQQTVALTGSNYITTTATAATSSSETDTVNISTEDIVYCTCSTGASTAGKTTTIVNGKLSVASGAPATGTIAVVKFSTANTAEQPTLKIGSTDAKNVYIQGTQVTSSNGGKSALAGTQTFIYDGTGWCLIGAQRGSGSVGSTSSATDAWKTVVHDVSQSNEHVISGNTKSIPAATSSNDGYMTSTQAGTLATLASALAWEE